MTPVGTEALPATAAKSSKLFNVNIRTSLRNLTLATLLPILFFGAAGAYLLLEREREVFERGARDRAQALANAIDAELRASIYALEVLAQSRSLDSDDVVAFRADAERALAARRGSWSNMVLSRADNAQMVMNLLLPASAALPEPSDAPTLLDAARSGRPTISRIVFGPVLKRPLFAVRVPVVRDGSVRFVLSAVIEATVVARLVERQGFPPGWAVAVLDGTHRFVSRLPQQDGDFASDSLKRGLASAPEGWRRGQLGDGTEIYRAWRRLAITDWSISIAIPRAVVEKSLVGIWLLIGGFVCAAAIGLGIAWRLARRIADPIAALARAAPAIGRGEVFALPAAAPLEEARELGRALAEAAGAVHDREERQREAERALRAADRAKDEFLAMLGHELRNPLASISNAAQILRVARERPDLIDTTNAILVRQVRHMKRLVDDLLEVGRLTSGKIQLEREPLELGAAVRTLLDEWKSDGRLAQHDVVAELNEAWVFADHARINQVASNLLDNALKYTPAGGRVDVTVGVQGGEATLAVSDTGEGIAPELAARVFDLFVQGERSLARERGGLGIGLTVARRLIELHGGTIRFASEGAGRGSTFMITLSTIARPAAAIDDASAAPPEARRILVVEDNADARDSLVALLRLAGHEVDAAETGGAAIAAVEAGVYDAVLVDIGLPDIDGYEVARQLRARVLERPLRLIALTGYGTQADRQRAFAAGFDAHLAKPVEPGALDALLRAGAENEAGVS